jgi:hypothetical protein
MCRRAGEEAAMRRGLRTFTLATLFSITLVTAGPATAQPTVAAATCALGETRLPNTTIFAFNQRQYSVFQLVRPSNCTSCTAGIVQLQSATWRMRFFAFCTVTIEISVVGAVDGVCPHPDTTDVLCAPITFQHTPTTTSSGENVVFPMSADCCISRPAFVRLKMLDTGTCTSNQILPYQIATPEPECTTCSSYSLPPGGPLQDSCIYPGAIHTISVQAQCCIPTPTGRQSWGQIKTIYR